MLLVSCTPPFASLPAWCLQRSVPRLPASRPASRDAAPAPQQGTVGARDRLHRGRSGRAAGQGQLESGPGGLADAGGAVPSATTTAGEQSPLGAKGGGYALKEQGEVGSENAAGSGCIQVERHPTGVERACFLQCRLPPAACRVQSPASRKLLEEPLRGAGLSFRALSRP